MMRRAIEVIEAGSWAGGELGSVTLAYDDRHRRRIKMIDDEGKGFLLDLEKATRLKDGDGLKLETGEIIRVRAAVEEVMDVTCDDSVHRARIAWHLGNRHTPIEVLKDGTLRLRYDHVLWHMVEGLGARVKRADAAFSPESGAYTAAGDHGGHDHAH